jgi:SHS2 domain-containing protein
LPALIAEAQVSSHRDLFCSSYDACLDKAAHEDWTSWTCARCARFRPPCHVFTRDAIFEAGGVTGDGRVPAPNEAVLRARPRTAPVSAPHERSEPAVPDASSHSLEQENGALHVRLEAPCMAALFIEAARAVAELVHGSPLEPAAYWADEVSIAARDREHLLVAWIAELVARSERARVRFGEVDIVYLSERQVVASIRGVRLGEVRGPVGAAAYYDPSLVQRGERVSATPVLDAGSFGGI